MVNNCLEYFADGTFNNSPKYFTQLYTNHGFKNGFYLLLVYLFYEIKQKTLA